MQQEEVVEIPGSERTGRRLHEALVGVATTNVARAYIQGGLIGAIAGLQPDITQVYRSLPPDSLVRPRP